MTALVKQSLRKHKHHDAVCVTHIQAARARTHAQISSDAHINTHSGKHVYMCMLHHK